MSDDTNRAARLRRRAKHQQFQLTKHSVRDPHAHDFGFYRLVDVTGTRPDPARGRMTLDDVEAYLDGSTL